MKPWLADQDDIRRVPDEAAILVLVGACIAIAGFVAAFFTDSGFATLVMTIGLLIAAWGMRLAERALDAHKSRLN